MKSLTKFFSTTLRSVGQPTTYPSFGDLTLGGKSYTCDVADSKAVSTQPNNANSGYWLCSDSPVTFWIIHSSASSDFVQNYLNSVKMNNTVDYTVSFTVVQ